jgi:hypothetical protein
MVALTRKAGWRFFCAKGLDRDSASQMIARRSPGKGGQSWSRTSHPDDDRTLRAGHGLHMAAETDEWGAGRARTLIHCTITPSSVLRPRGRLADQASAETLALARAYVRRESHCLNAAGVVSSASCIRIVGLPLSNLRVNRVALERMRQGTQSRSGSDYRRFTTMPIARGRRQQKGREEWRDARLQREDLRGAVRRGIAAPSSRVRRAVNLSPIPVSLPSTR